MPIKDKNLYYVGGVVRDEILGTPSLDIDLCYEGNAINFAKDLDIIKTNPDFGTVRVKLNDKEIDIASTRTETYPQKGHLPLVANIGCSLKEDLSRRDFTINALAKNTVTNEIVDYFNGLEDIKNKKIKVLHDNSFIDDPTRIVRGLKFAIRFGFKLDEHTKQLQDQYLANINYDMSYHRLKKELKETFNLNSKEALQQFIDQKMYKLIKKDQNIPKYNAEVSSLNNKYKPQYLYMTYLGLFDLNNFELNNEEKRIVENFKEIQNSIPQNDLEIYKLFREKPLESILLYASSVDFNIANRYLDVLQNVQIETSGNDLKNIGIEPSKIYKEIFDYILEQKIINPKISKSEELLLIKEKFL